nr:MAG: hypothetical protein [Microviridae sp.]
MTKLVRRIFICQGTFDPEVNIDKEIISGESMTIPDDALSIGQILEQFSHGITPDIKQNGYYSNTQDIDDTEPNPIDLTDLDEMREELKSIHAKIEDEKIKKSDILKAEKLEVTIKKRISEIAREAELDKGEKSAANKA